MRKIVFRGKVLDSQEWIYGSLEVFSDDNQQYARINFDEPYTDEELGITIPVGHDYLVYPETVGQFTGLHDKSGKEIYEGDIVKCGDFIYEVCYDGIRFASFVLIRKGDMFKHYFGEAMEATECEIIGNIHDGKEETK